jgi:hypothetical protein
VLATLVARPGGSVPPTEIAGAYAYRGDKKTALALLEQAYSARDSRLYWMQGELLLRNVEREPRYKAILRQMHVPD